jgi:hypothetical protein
VAPKGTIAVICVSESTTKVALAPSKNVTAVAPAKDWPMIVTTVPMEPMDGVIEDTTGEDA